MLFRSNDIANACRKLLIIDGLSSPNAHRRLKDIFPDRRIPTARTIRLWRAQMPEITSEEEQIIVATEREHIMLADELIHDALELAKERGPEWTLANLDTVNRVQGVYRDKQIRRQETARPTTVIPIQIVLNATEPSS